MKNPGVEELKQSGDFELIKTVPFENLLGFLLENIKPDTKTMGFFYFFLLLCVGFVFFFLFQPLYTWSQIFWLGLAGLISSFTWMVPIHELLHGLAYKIYGAGKLKFGMDAKQMMFYVTVNNFVMSRKQFGVLALFPFVGITMALLLLESLFPGPAVWFFISAIFWHATMCIGDFAMLAYYEKNRDMELFTYDNADEKFTYFYKKTRLSN